jgi:outer membrane protein TolC
MRRIRVWILSLVALTGLFSATGVDVTNTPASGNARPFVLDLPTTLQLAGARNLEIQIAREKLTEARADHESAVWQFFPSIIPGLGYRRHDDLIQDVAGNVTEVHKDSYTVGPTLSGQLDLGDAIYRKLAAHQRVKAAGFAAESQRQESLLAAAECYFDLTRSHAAGRVAEDSIRIAEEFAAQLKQAVGAGIAFRGDALRAEVQVDRNRLALRQAREQSILAAARLVRILHLDFSPETAMAVSDDGLVPLVLIATNRTLEAMVVRAKTLRPEIQQSRTQIRAAEDLRDGARYGPLVPSLGAQVFAGGLGGGVNNGPGRFGASEDYQFTLGWRLGPGGLFDRGRIRANESRLQVARLNDQKLADDITREVVEGLTRVQSLGDQLQTARHAVETASEVLRLAADRKEFAVGAVLERIQSEQDLTHARLDFLTLVAEFNKAQFALQKAAGEPMPSGEPTISHPR